jgi:hypothetical protein
MSWVYEGPEKIYVLLSCQEQIVSWSEQEITRNEQQDVEKVRILDADQNTAVAHCLTSVESEHEYQYAESINHDGSVYRYFTNPRIQDLFEVCYASNQGFELQANIKDTETWCEREAKKRRDFVKKYSDLYDFGDEINTEVDTFIGKIENYLTAMQAIYPWKYIEIDGRDIPKIPIRLLQILNLPPNGENNE